MVGVLPLIITVSDTCKNHHKWLDFDNTINLSNLIVSLETHEDFSQITMNRTRILRNGKTCDTMKTYKPAKNQRSLRVMPLSQSMVPVRHSSGPLSYFCPVVYRWKVFHVRSISLDWSRNTGGVGEAIFFFSLLTYHWSTIPCLVLDTPMSLFSFLFCLTIGQPYPV
jgi:hypothetical protein